MRLTQILHYPPNPSDRGGTEGVNKDVGARCEFTNLWRDSAVLETGNWEPRILPFFVFPCLQKRLRVPWDSLLKARLP